MTTPTAQPYGNSTWIGIALGVLLFITFVVTGRGLGVSGAFAAAAGDLLGPLAPLGANSDPALADRLPSGIPLLQDWIVLEVLGVFLGGALSAWLAGRLRTAPRYTSRSRLGRAAAGGILMGLGARLAYGCTSGLAISGGALLATGAWIFIVVAFGTAVLVTLVASGRPEDPTP